MGKETKPKPSQPLGWKLECQESLKKQPLKKLKRLFATEPLLKQPNPEKPFVIQTDASGVAVGTVWLRKNKKDDLQPCA